MNFAQLNPQLLGGKFSFAIILLTSIPFLNGCSTTVTATNKVTEVPTPQISINNAIANFEVGGEITGSGCAVDYLKLFGESTNKFLEVYGDGDSSALGRAKAAAAFNALNKDGLTTDFLVGPVFEINRDKTFVYGLFSDNYCVKVKGFRGIIKSFKADSTLTRPSPKKPGFFESFISSTPNYVVVEKDAQPTESAGRSTDSVSSNKQDVNVNIKVIDCNKKSC